MTNLSKAREEFITGLENYMEEFYNLGYEKAKEECGQIIHLLQAEICELNKYKVKQQQLQKRDRQKEVTNLTVEDMFETLRKLGKKI